MKFNNAFAGLLSMAIVSMVSCLYGAGKVVVASTNTIKVTAVSQALQDYPAFAKANICSLEPISGVSAQPLSLEETIQGAINRAKMAFEASDFGKGDVSFGIESGLMAVPQSKTGYMNVCVCAIYDGDAIHMGLSPAFECPEAVLQLIMKEGLDMNQAFKKAGLTADAKIGSGQGAVAILTKGRMDRIVFTKQAIMMAMAGIDKLNC